MLGSYPRSRCSHVFWRETSVVPGSRTDPWPAELERPVMSSTEASGRSICKWVPNRSTATGWSAFWATAGLGSSGRPRLPVVSAWP